MPIRFEGGADFERLVRNAGKGGVKQLEVGFFDSAKYQDGMTVPFVAVINEFGVGVPERPFFRPALKAALAPLRRILKAKVNPTVNVVTFQTAGLMGEQLRTEIQQGISDVRMPPNAPSTIKAKKSSKPLVDTGLMKASVTYKVIR